MRIIFAGVLLFVLPVPVFADSIDGSWCSKDGKHLSINGPEIVLPSDTKIQGTYRRHEFLYTVPIGDADTGSQIFMQLQSEDAMNSYHIKNNQAVDPVAWERCAVPPKLADKSSFF